MAKLCRRLAVPALLLGLLPGGPDGLRAAAPPSDVRLNSDSVREGQAAGTIVGILKAVDPDVGELHSFTLVAGEGAEDNARFATSGDTLRTAAVLAYTNKNRFHIRLRVQDGFGYHFEKAFTIAVTPPSFVHELETYFALNAAVSNLTLAAFDKLTLDYFWVYQNGLAAKGAIAIDRPANTPPDTATNGTSSVYLSATELARIHAAKAAHAVWLDQGGKVPWRLRDYTPEHLRGLFARTNLFNPQSSSVFFFSSVVDYSPTDAYHYVLDHGRIQATVLETVHAVLDDFRCDFLHGSASYRDPNCAYTLPLALTQYSTNRFRPARITRSGCHSMSRIILGVLRSVNIPGYETTTGEFFLPGHSEVVLPCIGRVLPHGDHIYSSALTATPVEDVMPTMQFFVDNLYTPPCAGDKSRVALRHEALQGTAHPTPTILGGVRNPASYGYTNAVQFLTSYAGWDRGLTTAELEQAVTNLLTQFNETRRLTLPAATDQGHILNTPGSTDYAKDSRVLLKGHPKAGYVFSHWTGDVPAGQATANPLVITMDSAKSIQAVFTRPPVMASIARGFPGEARIVFTALAGVSYTVEYREHLGAGSWLTLTNVPPQPATGAITNADPSLRIRPHRFYRVLTH